MCSERLTFTCRYVLLHHLRLDKEKANCAKAQDAKERVLILSAARRLPKDSRTVEEYFHSGGFFCSRPSHLADCTGPFILRGY
jgi:hypothetical protein